MVPVEALQLALNQEKKAIKMYEKFAIEFPTAKETFIFLLNEEQKHRIMLEKKIAEMTT